MHTPRRTAARLIGVVFASAVGAMALVGSAPAAYAHTELVVSAPAPQSQQLDPPRTVELRFSAPVVVSPGAIRVFDPAARRVDVGQAAPHADDSHTVSVPIATDLPPGSYTASWRVVADDGHPLEGAFTFRVGRGGRQTADTDRSIGTPSGSGGVVGGVLAASRWLMYAGLIVLVGGAAFVGLLWPAGWSDRRSFQLLWGSLATAAAGTAGGLLLQGPNATGRGFGAAFDTALQRELLGTRYATAGLVRLGLLTVTAALLVLRRKRPASRPTPRAVSWLAAAIGLILLITPTVTGHAAAADLAVLAVAVDAVHLFALALWLGGLAMLTTATLRADSVDRAVVARFSRLAFGCVLGVSVTGAVQGWREVRSVGALTNTRYGTLLVVKVLLFGALVGVAAVSRRWVQGRLTRDNSAALLRRSVGAEVVLAALVLLVAALLVAAPPARTAYAKPFRTQLRVASLALAVDVNPAKSGPVTLDVRTSDAAGADAPVTFVTIDLRLPAYDIGPLRVRMQRISASHYRASGIDLPLPGRWHLDADVFLGSGRTRASTSFDVT